MFFIKPIINYIRNIINNDKGGLSAGELPLTLSVGVLVGAAITVTSEVSQLNSIEELHIANVMGIFGNVEAYMAAGHKNSPELDDFVQISLQDLIDGGFGTETTFADPSTVSSNYHAAQSLVQIENVPSDTATGQEYRYYVKLVSSEFTDSNSGSAFQYINETIDDANGTKFQILDVSKDHVFLPERNFSAEISRQGL